MAVLAPVLLAQDGTPERGRGPRDNGTTIVVTGNGEVGASPDQAVVRLGVTAQKEDAQAAQAKVNEVMQKTLKEVEALGVPKRLIRTSGLTLSPFYAPERPANPGEGPRLAGFRANNTIEITLEDLKLIGKVIDAGIATGANELQGVTFSLKDDLAQRKAALTAAMDEAKQKAETIAESLRVKLGPAAEVTEGGVRIMPYNEGFAASRMMSSNAPRTPIEPGEIRVQGTVTVRYRVLAPRP